LLHITSLSLFYLFMVGASYAWAGAMFSVVGVDEGFWHPPTRASLELFIVVATLTYALPWVVGMLLEKRRMFYGLKLGFSPSRFIGLSMLYLVLAYINYTVAVLGIPIDRGDRLTALFFIAFLAGFGPSAWVKSVRETVMVVRMLGVVWGVLLGAILILSGVREVLMPMVFLDFFIDSDLLSVASGWAMLLYATLVPLSAVALTLALTAPRTIKIYTSRALPAPTGQDSKHTPQIGFHGLAKYPFLPEARELSSLIDLGKVSGEAIKRAVERIGEALAREGEGVSVKLDKPFYEFISFIVARELLRGLNDDEVLMKWAYAEAARVERILLTEGDDVLEQVAEALGIKFTISQDYYLIDSKSHVELTGQTTFNGTGKGVATGKPVKDGYVHLTRAEVCRLVRDVVHRLLTRSDEGPARESLPEPLAAALNDVKKLAEQWRASNESAKGLSEPLVKEVEELVRQAESWREKARQASGEEERRIYIQTVINLCYRLIEKIAAEIGQTKNGRKTVIEAVRNIFGDDVTFNVMVLRYMRNTVAHEITEKTVNPQDQKNYRKLVEKRLLTVLGNGVYTPTEEGAHFALLTARAILDRLKALQKHMGQHPGEDGPKYIS